ncbi:MAG: hypothetical protein CMN48_03715 [SAR116 cluster bacterium]|nr:hypothetical protein [SAR116 cluster bacterium]|tara:strand:+ start:1377 stop:4349 length:2973 start_codon:yes stop_codon:yes gene_type:complete
MLGIDQDANTNGVGSTVVQGSETTASSSVNAAEAFDLASSELSHTLVLKDRLEGGAHLLSLVTIDSESLDSVGNFLTSIQTKLTEANNLQLNSPEYETKVAELQAIENQMSAFLGALFHKNEIDVELKSGDSSSAQSFLDFVNIFEDPDDQSSLVGQIASLEVNMLEFARAAHDPQTCPTCIKANQSGTSNNEGEIPLAIGPSPTGSVTGSLNNTTNSGDNATAINTLMLGKKWDIADPTSETLTYSYYNGSVAYPTSQSDYGASGGLPVANAPSTVSSHDSDNETHLDLTFNLWDDVVDFDFEKISETSTEVGEMRVAFTDRSSEAAAFAYQPGGTPANGDVWFEEEDNGGFDPSYQFGSNLTNYGTSSSTISKMGLGSEGYSFRSSIHEIGHAIGLSHPFDGTSFTGNTLSTSLDVMRNTVMSYTSFDRNRAVSFNTYADLTAANNGTVLNNYDYQNLDSISIGAGNYFGASSDAIYAATPMVYDIATADHMYNSSGFTGDTRTNNNTYKYADKVMAIHTIVDGGGTDTIDASAVTNANRSSTINLTPGAFSSIATYTRAQQLADVEAAGGATAKSNVESYFATLDALADTGDAIYTGQENVAIAHYSLIENAIGGAGNDTITGNYANNRISGGGGNDTIDGGDGEADIAVFSGDKSEYTITGDSSSGYTVLHNSGGSDGTDNLTGIEFFEFTQSGATVAEVETGDVVLSNFSLQETFDMKINGNDYTVTLNARDYTAGGLTEDDFAADMQTAINAAVAGGDSVTVTTNSPLIIQTNATGVGSSITFANLSALMQTALGVTDATASTANYVNGANSGVTVYYDPTNPLFPYRIALPSGAAGTSSGSSIAASGSSSSNSGSTSSSSTEAVSQIINGVNQTFIRGKHLNSIDISTQEGASQAIEILDIAIETIASNRARLGAVINRLNSTIENLVSQSSNTEIAKGRIMDADFASEMAKLVKHQVLSQAAIQVLNRANSGSGQYAMRLIS